MTQDVDATLDIKGAFAQPSVSTSSRRALWLLIGLLAGLSIGQVSVGLSPTSNGSSTADPRLFLPLPSDSVSMGESLPNLVGVEVTGDRGYQLVSGSLDGPLTGKPLGTDGWDSVSIDQSGKWFAVGDLTSDGNGLLLVGSGSNLLPLSTTMTSFAWHDSRPGILSYTERDQDGGWQLQVSEMGGRARVIVSSDEDLGELAAWGAWGWAIQRSDDSIAFLDGSGQEWESAQGLALDSHETGWLLTIHPAGLNIVVPGGGVVYLEIDHETIGGVGAASFSPDRKQVVLIGPYGVKITDINGERPAITLPLPSLPTAVAWSSGSRYALIALDRGLAVVDTTDDEPRVSYAWRDRSFLALLAQE